MSEPKKKDSPAGEPVSQEKTDTKQARTVKRAVLRLLDCVLAIIEAVPRVSFWEIRQRRDAIQTKLASMGQEVAE